MRRFYLPVAIGGLILAFWIRPEIQTIAAGVAIFLFGMLMLEDGCKLFGGGLLERTLERATRSTPRSVLFGVVSTTLLQSSSLVSVIAISFLSADLISLLAGVGIVFGANLGTTTGAWLVAGLGLKVNIAAYAMPMIALGIILVFHKPKVARGIGYALGGLGFLFLGIHYMKEGFDTFQGQIDLSRYAIPGILGLAVYTLLGTVATVVMQSSHATMVLIITALAAGQITYENSLALAIGANIGTTVTAVIGAIGANFQGKRLALAHLIFNSVTAAVALAFISPLRESVEWVSANLGIVAGDFALRLAVFHTLFNLFGVMLMLPVLHQLIRFLERVIVEPLPDVSRPRYLEVPADAFPQALESALRKEVMHLYQNAVALILRGLNLSQTEVYASQNIAETVRTSRQQFDFDIDEGYERKLKTLYAAIVDFATLASERQMPAEIAGRLYALRDASTDIVKAVKAVKHLRKNVNRFTSRPQGVVTELYDQMRADLARIVVEIHQLELAQPDQRSGLWLDQERGQVEEAARSTTRDIDMLIRRRGLDTASATSFINDSGYAYGAMRHLLEAARSFYLDRDTALAEVERMLALEDDELDVAVSAQQSVRK